MISHFFSHWPPAIYFFAYKALNIIFWNARATTMGLRKEKKKKKSSIFIIFLISEKKVSKEIMRVY